ncbi:hypothetical protein FF1_027723 [Malus domestica]
MGLACIKLTTLKILWKQFLSHMLLHLLCLPRPHFCLIFNSHLLPFDGFSPSRSSLDIILKFVGIDLDVQAVTSRSQNPNLKFDIFYKNGFEMNTILMDENNVIWGLGSK